MITRILTIIIINSNYYNQFFKITRTVLTI